MVTIKELAGFLKKLCLATNFDENHRVNLHIFCVQCVGNVVFGVAEIRLKLRNNAEAFRKELKKVPTKLSTTLSLPFQT